MNLARRDENELKYGWENPGCRECSNIGQCLADNFCRVFSLRLLLHGLNCRTCNIARSQLLPRGCGILFLRATCSLPRPLKPFPQSTPVEVVLSVLKRCPVADINATPRPLGCVRPRCSAQAPMAAPESMRISSGSGWAPRPTEKIQPVLLSLTYSSWSPQSNDPAMAGAVSTAFSTAAVLPEAVSRSLGQHSRCLWPCFLHQVQ